MNLQHCLRGFPSLALSLYVAVAQKLKWRRMTQFLPPWYQTVAFSCLLAVYYLPMAGSRLRFRVGIFYGEDLGIR